MRVYLVCFSLLLIVSSTTYAVDCRKVVEGLRPTADEQLELTAQPPKWGIEVDPLGGKMLVSYLDKETAQTLQANDLTLSVDHARLILSKYGENRADNVPLIQMTLPGPLVSIRARIIHNKKTGRDTTYFAAMTDAGVFPMALLPSGDSYRVPYSKMPASMKQLYKWQIVDVKKEEQTGFSEVKVADQGRSGWSKKFLVPERLLQKLANIHNLRSYALLKGKKFSNMYSNPEDAFDYFRVISENGLSYTPPTYDQIYDQLVNALVTGTRPNFESDSSHLVRTALARAFSDPKWVALLQKTINEKSKGRLTLVDAPSSRTVSEVLYKSEHGDNLKSFDLIISGVPSGATSLFGLSIKPVAQVSQDFTSVWRIGIFAYPSTYPIAFVKGPDLLDLGDRVPKFIAADPPERH